MKRVDIHRGLCPGIDEKHASVRGDRYRPLRRRGLGETFDLPRAIARLPVRVSRAVPVRGKEDALSVRRPQPIHITGGIEREAGQRTGREFVQPEVLVCVEGQFRSIGREV